MVLCNESAVLVWRWDEFSGECEWTVLRRG